LDLLERSTRSIEGRYVSRRTGQPSAVARAGPRWTTGEPRSEVARGM